jgi:hypothetical protein
MGPARHFRGVRNAIEFSKADARLLGGQLASPTDELQASAAHVSGLLHP